MLAEFTELVKTFDKVRDYMRDFYVYGFKVRKDFTQKSKRTYDNEKRRIESYLSKYIIWDYSKNGKAVFISIDSSKINSNPLYLAWRAKSFTDNDIVLHFYLIDILQDKQNINIEQLTDILCERSLIIFDVQTVRNKCKEYVKLGLFSVYKDGKKSIYNLNLENVENLTESTTDAIMLFQEILPFGMLGNTILEDANKINDLFSFKHHYIVHTLEDEILLQILNAISSKKEVQLTNTKTGQSNTIKGIPICIFVSLQTGRRYVCVYINERNNFINYRLDNIKSIKTYDVVKDYEIINDMLKRKLNKCFGVSFGNSENIEEFSMKIQIDEQREHYVLERLKRECRNGTIEKLGDNIFLYKINVFDSNELLAWVKTFTGRIIEVNCTKDFVARKVYKDIYRMKNMYNSKK